MRKYEIMFILSTQLTDEVKKEAISFVEGLLTKEGATSLETSVLGDKKLAYPINKKEFGHYVLTTFEIDGKKLADIEKRLNIYENIMKYILVKN